MEQEQTELENIITVNFNKEYYDGNLYSSQSNSNCQESLNRAQSLKDPVKIMISPQEEIIILDGHHRVAVSIIEDNPILAEVIEYNKPSRVWKYKVFFREIVKQYPAGYIAI